ncbi:MAG TPA: hypothetical protein VKB80_14965 [Kofleriaceae bacterium]|nr:hypothetical protein [Kofleriaceae bacterium]
MSASVGADIEALCSKCGDVWHVVVAKVGADIVKVQCKECHGYHRYRRSGAPASSSKARSPSSPARRASSSRAPARARTATAPPAPATFKADPGAPTRAYHMRETYHPGEQISHPRFGVGLVEQTTEPGKIAVVFSDGRKLLAQAKPESTLGTANHMSSLTAEED